MNAPHISSEIELNFSHADIFPVLHEMSNLLNTGLDRATLSILIELCGKPAILQLKDIYINSDRCFTETGVNPEALAAVVKELRREAAAIRDAAR